MTTRLKGKPMVYRLTKGPLNRAQRTFAFELLSRGRTSATRITFCRAFSVKVIILKAEENEALYYCENLPLGHVQ